MAVEIVRPVPGRAWDEFTVALHRWRGRTSICVVRTGVRRLSLALEMVGEWTTRYGGEGEVWLEGRLFLHNDGPEAVDNHHIGRDYLCPADAGEYVWDEVSSAWRAARGRVSS
jgi:hypothetical protein